MHKDLVCDLLNIENDEIKLSERSTEIDTKTQNKEVRDIVAKLKHTVREHNLIALSAPEIGIQKRIFVINFKEEIKTFINPVIISAKGIQLSKETCNIITNKSYLVPRNDDIQVAYQGPTGNYNERQLIGAAAFIFQHEMQHLDGLLISDIGLEIDEEFENATDDEKNEIINIYLDSLDMKQKTVEQEINDNSELKAISDAIDFMTSVYQGKTEIIQEVIDEPVNKDETGV